MKEKLLVTRIYSAFGVVITTIKLSNAYFVQEPIRCRVDRGTLAPEEPELFQSTNEITKSNLISN